MELFKLELFHRWDNSDVAWIVKIILELEQFKCYFRYRLEATEKFGHVPNVMFRRVSDYPIRYLDRYERIPTNPITIFIKCMHIKKFYKIMFIKLSN